MNAISVHQQKAALRRDTAKWQKAALGMFALSLTVSLVQESRINGLETARQEIAAQLQQAEHTRDLAIQQLGAAVLQYDQDQQARAEQAAAYEELGKYRYIGKCTITAYCPCEACCGVWADGLTASGVPAGPGIVAVDPEVVPLGSTVLIDGQKYLAADTGVKGLRVDVCMDGHAASEAFGVRPADVWVVEP